MLPKKRKNDSVVISRVTSPFTIGPLWRAISRAIKKLSTVLMPRDNTVYSICLRNSFVFNGFTTIFFYRFSFVHLRLAKPRHLLQRRTNSRPRAAGVANKTARHGEDSIHKKYTSLNPWPSSVVWLIEQIQDVSLRKASLNMTKKEALILWGCIYPCNSWQYVFVFLMYLMPLMVNCIGCYHVNHIILQIKIQTTGCSI